MMKHIAAALTWMVLLGIAGCGVTPPQKVEEGERFNFKSALTPYATAICIARNAKRRSGNIGAEEKTLGDTSWEVIVRSRGETLAVAQVDIEGIGSKVLIRVTTSIRVDRKGFARQLMTEC